MFYTPDDLAKLWEHEDTSVFTPVFVWCYLILAVILFVSCLSALLTLEHLLT